MTDDLASAAGQILSNMARGKLVEPYGGSSGSDHAQTTAFGIYKHDLSKDGAPASLVGVHASRKQAQTAMRTDAMFEVQQNTATWGEVQELTTKHLYEIIDSYNIVRLRFEIAIVQSAGKDTQNQVAWERVPESVPEPQRRDPPPVHFGVYSATNFEVLSHAPLFTGGYDSLGEATHEILALGRTYPGKHERVNILETSVDVMDRKGSVQHRYWVEQGRLINGAFVKEEDWQQQDKAKDNHKSPSVLRLPGPAAAYSSKSPHPSAAETSRASSPSPEDQASSSEEDASTPWCICRQPENGEKMVGCDNEDCSIEWFHFSCVGLEQSPGEEDKWFCETCAAEMKAESEKQAKSVSKGVATKKKTG